MYTEKDISIFVKSQFPRFYDEEGPMFIEFVKSYYEWMEQDGNPVGDSRSLLSYRDIDTTIDQFITHFQKTYLADIPDAVKGDKRFLIKHILDVYRAKGTIQGYKLLFRLLYNEDITIYLPSRDILKPSDGTWYEPKYLEVNYKDYVKTLSGKLIRGSSSNTSAVVEQYIEQPTNGRTSYILYLSNITGSFSRGEKIVAQEDFGTPTTLSAPTVLGSLTGMIVTSGGRDFVVGDTLKVIQGKGEEGEARVSETANGTGTLLFTIENGGTLFSRESVSIITRTTQNNAPLAGRSASFKVGNLSNQREVTFNTDVVIDRWYQQFSNGQVTNVHVTAGGTGYSNTTNNFVQFVAQSHIDHVEFVSRGSGYANGDVIRFTGGSVEANGILVTDSSGEIRAVDIKNVGYNFPSNTTGTITTDSGSGANITGIALTLGSGANAYIVTDNSGEVAEVRISANGGGSQYVVPPKIVFFGGTGATAIANTWTDYLFSNIVSANAFTELTSALTFRTLDFGTIASLDSITTGNNYQYNPVVHARDVIYSREFSGNVFYANTSANVTGNNTNFTFDFKVGDIVKFVADPEVEERVDHRFVTSISNDTFMTLDDYPNFTSNGNIQSVLINDTGIGYANSDTITTTGVGTGASFKLKTDVSGAIVDVTVLNEGSGYYIAPTLTINSNTGSGGVLTAQIMFAKYYLAPNKIEANFDKIDDPSRYAVDGTMSGQNELITGVPSFGTGIISKVQIKNSGFNYEDGETLVLATYGAISNVDVISSGTKYANGDILNFAGGSPISEASGIVQTDANGAITSAVLTYAGSGYKDVPKIFIISKTGSGGSLTPNIGGLNTFYRITGIADKGGIGKTRGFWTSTQGFLSSDKYIQDSYYYQEYSYEINSEVSMSRYISIIKEAYHMLGTEMFGRMVKKSEEVMEITIPFNELTIG